MDYLAKVRKEISKYTGLTGVEAGHIARQLEKQGQDYQAFDWKTIGENMYGHGHRTGGVKSIVHQAYGVNIGDFDMPGAGVFLEREVHARQGRRSPRALEMDNRINARKRFKITNEKGVRKWLKRPNMYDIEGVDDIIKLW